MAHSAASQPQLHEIEKLCESIATLLYDNDIGQIKLRYSSAAKLYNIRTQCFNMFQPPKTKNNQHWTKYRDVINEKRNIQYEYDDSKKQRTGRCGSQFERYQNDANLYQTFKTLGDARVEQLIEQHHITSWQYQMKICKV